MAPEEIRQESIEFGIRQRTRMSDEIKILADLEIELKEHNIIYKIIRVKKGIRYIKAYEFTQDNKYVKVIPITKFKEKWRFLNYISNLLVIHGKINV